MNCSNLKSTTGQTSPHQQTRVEFGCDNLSCHQTAMSPIPTANFHFEVEDRMKVQQAMLVCLGDCAFMIIYDRLWCFRWPEWPMIHDVSWQLDPMIYLSRSIIEWVPSESSTVLFIALVLWVLAVLRKEDGKMDFNWCLASNAIPTDPWKVSDMLQMP